MSRSLNAPSVAFTAGVVGAVVNSAALLAASRYHLLQLLHVNLIVGFSLPWLYLRLVWGGLWALLLLLPMGPRSALGRGLFWSLGPSLFQLLWVFPQHTPLGVLGLGAGQLTPLVVLIVNGIWGVTAALWLRGARG